ncbi:hypothetical protein LXL04_033361 [Taraxacum kok-saghyz]
MKTVQGCGASSDTAKMQGTKRQQIGVAPFRTSPKCSRLAGNSGVMEVKRLNYPQLECSKGQILEFIIMMARTTGTEKVKRRIYQIPTGMQ